MKQNITISVERLLLRKARAIAAQRGESISPMIADVLASATDRESEYAQARRRALARLATPFHLGGEGRAPREVLYDSQN